MSKLSKEEKLELDKKGICRSCRKHGHKANDSKCPLYNHSSRNRQAAVQGSVATTSELPANEPAAVEAPTTKN